MLINFLGDEIMTDVTIKDVPSGAEDKVMELAMVAIERFKKQSLVVPEAEVKTFEDEVDAIREANKLAKKYDTKEVVIEPIELEK